MRAAFATAALLTCILWSPTAHAGRSCDEKPADPNRLMQGFELAQKVKLSLDQSGAQLAISSSIRI